MLWVIGCLVHPCSERRLHRWAAVKLQARLGWLKEKHSRCYLLTPIVFINGNMEKIIVRDRIS